MSDANSQNQPAQSMGIIALIGMVVDQFVSELGFRVLKLVNETGAIFMFAIEAVKWWVRAPRLNEVIRHMEFVGNQSIFIIALTGVFTGMALSYQIFIGFQMVNATNLVGPVVALGISHELGPVLTGLVIAARAGGAMAARIGTMRVTEQIDAIEVMSVDPVQYLVSPRMLAAVIATPMLCAVFDFMAMAGSYFLSVFVLDLDRATYWAKVQAWIVPHDIYQGLFKAAIFGFIFASICTYCGFRTEGGARGVGEATNRGVVISMVMIIVLDYFLSNFIQIYFHLPGMP